jgi:hypothetical protein
MQEYAIFAIIHLPNKTPKDIFCQVSYEARELAGKGIRLLPYTVAS